MGNANDRARLGALLADRASGRSVSDSQIARAMQLVGDPGDGTNVNDRACLAGLIADRQAGKRVSHEQIARTEYILEIQRQNKLRFEASISSTNNAAQAYHFPYAQPDRVGPRPESLDKHSSPFSATSEAPSLRFLNMTESGILMQGTTRNILAHVEACAVRTHGVVLRCTEFEVLAFWPHGGWLLQKLKPNTLGAHVTAQLRKVSHHAFNVLVTHEFRNGLNMRVKWDLWFSAEKANSLLQEIRRSAPS